jgi:hypothetical protein
MSHTPPPSMVDPPPPNPQNRSWLIWPPEDKRPPMKYAGLSTGGDPNRQDCYIKIEHLTPAEVSAVEAFLNGSAYLRCIGGRLHSYHAYEQLPDAESDPLLAPHWPNDGEPKEFGGIPTGEGWHMPGIVITALGAGGSHYHDEPARSAKILTDCGFHCLRSPKGEDGKYWEQWVINSLWGARGRLKEHLDEWGEQDHVKKMKDKTHWHKQAEEACRFLVNDLQIAFGSMDITIQRWALCAPD